MSIADRILVFEATDTIPSYMVDSLSKADLISEMARTCASMAFTNIFREVGEWKLEKIPLKEDYRDLHKFTLRVALVAKEGAHDFYKQIDDAKLAGYLEAIKDFRRHADYLHAAGNSGPTMAFGIKQTADDLERAVKSGAKAS